MDGIDRVFVAAALRDIERAYEELKAVQVEPVRMFRVSLDLISAIGYLRVALHEVEVVKP